MIGGEGLFVVVGDGAIVVVGDGTTVVVGGGATVVMGVVGGGLVFTVVGKAADVDGTSSETLLSHTKRRILDFGQLALTESQFEVFRKLVLDEFGKRGLESELDKLFANLKRQQER